MESSTEPCGNKLGRGNISSPSVMIMPWSLLNVSDLKLILEKKQALIEANVYKTSDRKGNPIWRMKVYNKGKAKGSNINFKSETLSNDQGIIITDGLEMFPLPSLLQLVLENVLSQIHLPMWILSCALADDW